MTFKEAIHAAGAHHQGRPRITMWEALRAATDHVPTEVAAEDSASHFQHFHRSFPFHLRRRHEAWKSDYPFEGGAGGRPVVNMAWHWKAGGQPPPHPLIGGFSWELPEAHNLGTDVSVISSPGNFVSGPGKSGVGVGNPRGFSVRIGLLEFS